MDASVVLACIGAGISLYGIAQYINGILKHGTKPRMASWAAWLTANTVFTIVAIQEHAWLAVAINGTAVLTNTLVVLASVKKRVSLRPTDAVDWACLIVSVLSVALVLIMPENKIAVALLAMGANLVATTPTFRHAWQRPREETWQLFGANVVANGLGVASVVMVSGVELAAIAGPLVATLGNTALVSITLGRGWFTAAEHEIEREVQALEELVTEGQIDS
ncbi:MAG TPA: hypothetical protein VJ841_01810 [Candidatus Saccharimonadales bacterium]|nr:hypothetical protein [Candidatus Saccharimonadales bacterium]